MFGFEGCYVLFNLIFVVLLLFMDNYYWREKKIIKMNFCYLVILIIKVFIYKFGKVIEL